MVARSGLSCTAARHPGRTRRPIQSKTPDNAPAARVWCSPGRPDRPGRDSGSGIEKGGRASRPGLSGAGDEVGTVAGTATTEQTIEPQRGEGPTPTMSPGARAHASRGHGCGSPDQDETSSLCCNRSGNRRLLDPRPTGLVCRSRSISPARIRVCEPSEPLRSALRLRAAQIAVKPLTFSPQWASRETFAAVISETDLTLGSKRLALPPTPVRPGPRAR